jgi:hypothetical protein
MAEMSKVYDETGRELYMGLVIGSMIERATTFNFPDKHDQT